MGSSPSTQKGLRQKPKDPENKGNRLVDNSSAEKGAREAQTVDPAAQKLNDTSYLEIYSNMAGITELVQPSEPHKISQKNVDYEKLREKDKEERQENVNWEKGLDEKSNVSDSIKREMLCDEVKLPKEKCLDVIRMLKASFENGDPDRSSVLKQLHGLSKAYIDIESLRPDIYRIVGSSILDFLIDNNVDEYIYEMAIEILPKTCKNKGKSKVSRTDRVSAIVIFNSLINFTDVSDRICSRVCEKTEFLEVMTESLAYHAVFMGTWDCEDVSRFSCSCMLKVTMSQHPLSRPVPTNILRHIVKVLDCSVAQHTSADR